MSGKSVKHERTKKQGFMGGRGPMGMKTEKAQDFKGTMK